jgi:hypothetical protein
MNEPVEQLIIDGVRQYGAMDRGSILFMMRSTDEATFDEQALLVALTVYTNPAQTAVVDLETEEIITPAIEASGPIIPIRDVTITKIGSHVLTAGSYDAEGNEITAPVLDTRFHANVWIGPRIVARGEWMQWSTLWTHYGSAIVANAQEDGTAMRGIELIDPATVAHPTNVLL